MTDPLEVLPEDWERVLIIVAHPDDVEFGGTAGAVARWVNAGKWVGYTMLTSGEAGIDAVAPEKAGRIREREQIRACTAVGVSTVEFRGLPDGHLEPGLPLRREVVGAIRRHRPDVIVTLNVHDSWGQTEVNQPDHVAVGRAILDAAVYASNRWIFRDQVETDGLEPWQVKAVLVAGSPYAKHGVDITDTFDDAVAALAEHKVYNLGLRWRGFEARTWLDRIAGEVGPRLGVRYAVAFETFRF